MFFNETQPDQLEFGRKLEIFYGFWSEFNKYYLNLSKPIPRIEAFENYMKTINLEHLEEIAYAQFYMRLKFNVNHAIRKYEP